MNMVNVLGPAMLFCLVVMPSAAQEAPPRDGLQLWLDASDGRTVSTDDGGSVVTWMGKSGHGRDAVSRGEGSGPRLVKDAMNDRPVARYSLQPATHQGEF